LRFTSTDNTIAAASSANSDAVAAAGASVYEWPVETRYYSSRLRIRCAREESIHVPNVLSRLQHLDVADADSDEENAGRRREQSVVSNEKVAGYGYDDVQSLLADDCEALLILFDSSVEGSFATVRQHGGLISSLRCDIVACVDVCTDESRVRELPEADNEWRRKRFVELITLAPTAMDNNANEFGFARVRDLLYAHSWRNTTQRKVVERRPTTANGGDVNARRLHGDDEDNDIMNNGHSRGRNGNDNGVVHVDDDAVHDDDIAAAADDRDSNTPRLSDLATFDAAMSELSRASTSDVHSLTRDERHARAQRLLNQFLDAAGLDLNDL